MKDVIEDFLKLSEDEQRTAFHLAQELRTNKKKAKQAHCIHEDREQVSMYEEICNDCGEMLEYDPIVGGEDD